MDNLGDRVMDSKTTEKRRAQLAREVESQGIHDPRVLQAISRVPRHRFVNANQAHLAYENHPLPVGGGQTISQPFTVAWQTQALELREGDKVLEIGTGSGYQAAVLCELGVELHTIERQSGLLEKATGVLRELGYTFQSYLGDGYLGLPEEAPFDAILVTAAAPKVPETLLQQLRRPTGRMIVPVGEAIQTMVLLRFDERGSPLREDLGEFRFVPMLKGIVPKQESDG